MQKVKSVGVLSFAKMFGFIHACLGLVFAPLFLLVGLAASIGHDKSAAVFGGVFGIVMAILMPVLYGAMGFVMGTIGALLYNLFAGWVGGIELQLEAAPSAQAAPYSPAVSS